MNTIKNIFKLFVFSLLFFACNKSENIKKAEKIGNDSIKTQEENIVKKENNFTDNAKPKAFFIPEGYKLFEEYFGDLNKDGIDDCVLIIKDTKPENIVVNRFEEKVDRNRRGIIVLFKKGNGYELITKNYDCFASENEDGGTYFAPELDIRIENGNLFVHYAHGRYGYWAYNFRHQNNDFELIGYDSSDNFGPVTQSTTSINFLTKKKLVKTNVNPQEEAEEEVFESKWYRIKIEKLIKLSEIKDFDELEVYR